MGPFWNYTENFNSFEQHSSAMKQLSVKIDTSELKEDKRKLICCSYLMAEQRSK